MKLNWTKKGKKYWAGVFEHKAWIQQWPKYGWLYEVHKNGKFVAGGIQKTLEFAKTEAEHEFFKRRAK